MGQGVWARQHTTTIVARGASYDDEEENAAQEGREAWPGLV